jgi:hypothetical protein
LKKLGAKYVINYNEEKNWGDAAKAFTLNNRGVDFVIDVCELSPFDVTNSRPKARRLTKYQRWVAQPPYSKACKPSG